MRYRMMAVYRGVPYEAGVGPSSGNVVLFAACPPPEGLGFEPAIGHWRKQVIRAEVDALWESRPVGIFSGEPCIVLDDLGDRLHIAYLGMDADRALHLGYWQVDRGVFELLAPREDVTGLAEERVDKPLHWVPPATDATPPACPYGPAHRPAPAGVPSADPEPALAPPAGLEPAGLPSADLEPALAPPGNPWPVALPSSVAQAAAGPESQDPSWRAPAGSPAPGGRAARRQRVPTREIFHELADLAGIPRSAYVIESETDGAFCLMPSAGGFQVFLASAGTRLEMRSFADEEAAFFYLFGVLAAEAIRNGSLIPSGSAIAAGQAG